MRVSVLTVTVGLSSLAALYACVEVQPDTDLCARACSAASDCGLLPSALGGSVGASRSNNEEDCYRRCLASDERNVRVSGLLDVLAAEDYGDDSLCSAAGTDKCEELVEVLETTAATTELEVTSTLTVRMTSAVSHAANYSIESLCCFDYGEDSGDVMEAVYDMFGPTSECFTDTAVALLAVRDAKLADSKQGGTDPSEETTELCTTLVDLWQPQMLKPGGPNLDADPCYLARLSTRVSSLDIPTKPDRCLAMTAAEIDDARMELSEIRRDWSLEPGDLLVEEDGELRSLEDIRLGLEERIDDEIDRPMGFLAEACAEFDCDAEVEKEPCTNGPVCSRADCLIESTSCDATLCTGESSPPGQDCDVFGVTEVRLGYRNERGLEVLGEPIDGCQTQSQLQTTFEDVGVGLITPIANVSGTLPSAFFVDGQSQNGDGTYKWSIEGDPRWVAAGEAVLTLPSPMIDYLIAELQDPMEYLHWVPRRLPLGADCVNQPRGCEGFFNDNCADGLDNDNNGLIDDEDPWCDNLFSELVSRCVVVQPGSSPLVECEPMGEPPEFDD